MVVRGAGVVLVLRAGRHRQVCAGIIIVLPFVAGMLRPGCQHGGGLWRLCLQCYVCGLQSMDGHQEMADFHDGSFIIDQWKWSY